MSEQVNDFEPDSSIVKSGIRGSRTLDSIPQTKGSGCHQHWFK